MAAVTAMPAAEAPTSSSSSASATVCASPAKLTKIRGDPWTRYSKGELLGSGAVKNVYKAFDESDGVEVAWNEIYVSDESWANANDKNRLLSEIWVLQQLKHRNIMRLEDWWYDYKKRTLIFITELFTDGSLRQYRHRHRRIDLRVLKRWAWEILQGLVYLHGHNPPIIHRDLKSDNIFCNGTSGTIKIGDLGFATLQRGLAARLSCIGTPEFMAPELYEEQYDAKVDVYSYGMCLLELATMSYPYSECPFPAQIFKKVIKGIPPEGLLKVQDDDMREFIKLCIRFDPAERPESRQLLKHSFFDSIRTCNGMHSKCHSSAALVIDNGTVAEKGKEGHKLVHVDAPPAVNGEAKKLDRKSAHLHLSRRGSVARCHVAGKSMDTALKWIRKKAAHQSLAAKVPRAHALSGGALHASLTAPFLHTPPQLVAGGSPRPRPDVGSASGLSLPDLPMKASDAIAIVRHSRALYKHRQRLSNDLYVHVPNEHEQLPSEEQMLQELRRRGSQGGDEMEEDSVLFGSEASTTSSPFEVDNARRGSQAGQDGGSGDDEHTVGGGGDDDNLSPLVSCHPLEDGQLGFRIEFNVEGRNQEISFHYNTETDTAESIACEMVENLSLDSNQIEALGKIIQQRLDQAQDSKPSNLKQ